MILFTFKLILAHFLGDFVFQPTHWRVHKLKNKVRSPYLYLHLGIHLLLLLIILQFEAIWGIALIITTHFFIDWGKLSLTNAKNERWLFALDQILHLLVIVLVVHIYKPFLVDFKALFSAKNMLMGNCLVFVTFVSGILMKMLLLPYITDLDAIDQDGKEGASLKNAGRYIGMLERLFVFGFIVADQWSAIGFLITAKSVFRFGDLNKGDNRKLTEYVLIGTLVSFGLAILTGLFYNYCTNNLL